MHEFLGSRQEFSHWWKKRVKEYNFSQVIDFCVNDNFINDVSAFGGVRKTTAYHISLNMAKELSMVEKTEKGRQARRYFIEVEQRATRQYNDLMELNNKLKDHSKESLPAL
ncbi:antA/AntB antirepressor family protein [Acinetobacter sp. B5B]|nr:antA/AntB antirepressor family protein [Acinetobacter baretiae]